jgi:hypothetical protein
LAEKIRKVLADFYGTLKTVKNQRGLVFVTGTSYLAKTLFSSSLNNLQDLTFDSNYADICGLNASEFDIFLGERQGQTLEALMANGSMPPGSAKDDLKRLVLDWYDGYSWDGMTKVLNPWSVFSFFQRNTVGDYWYGTGTPTFLKNWLSSSGKKIDITTDNIIIETENMIAELDNIKTNVLLFQTGYLTVKEVLADQGDLVSYRLGPPNLEVKASLIPLTLGSSG